MNVYVTWGCTNFKGNSSSIDNQFAFIFCSWFESLEGKGYASNKVLGFAWALQSSQGAYLEHLH